jgi:hypothetical protein
MTAQSSVVPMASGLCNGQDYFVYGQESGSISGTTMGITIHYRANSDCSHTFYYSYITFASGSGPAWWEYSQICQPGYSDPSHCTPTMQSGDGKGTNIPVYVYYTSGSNVIHTNNTTWYEIDDYCTSQGILTCNTMVRPILTFVTN